MIRARVNPDDRTFPYVLTACAEYVEVQKGLEIHAAVFKLGFDYDVYVGNTLIQFYGNCCELMSARKVFEEMSDRDVISWNTCLKVCSVNGVHREALRLFQCMWMDPTLRPNMVTVVTVLPICSELEDEKTTRQIHGFSVKTGLDNIVTVGNSLIDSYGKCGNMEVMKQVFNQMIEKNEVSWNTLITSFANQADYADAVDSFRLMIRQYQIPNPVTISAMLPVLAELKLFSLAKEVHCFSIRTGLEYDIFVSNSLIDTYAKSGHPTKSSYIFRNMTETNIVSWNAMVANFAQNKLEEESLNLVREMQCHGETPNSMTLTNVLPACSRTGSLLHGQEIHARAIRTGLETDLFISNSLSDMYAKCSCLTSALNMFNMSQRDQVSYNVLITGYSQTPDCKQSIILFKEMWARGMKHDVVSFVGVISACANLSAIKQGKEIHGLLIRRFFHNHLFVANSLLDLYMKCGQIEVARTIFDRIPDRDVTSWNTMILGYGMLGELDTAFSLLESMKQDNIPCDSVTYIAVLTACSHGGLVERGIHYFNEMGIEPTATHYACVVDLLGRAGFMEEAMDFIKNLPFKPDADIWGALIGACRVHGNVELGCWVADQLFELKPWHCGYYVILCNMYVEAGRWEDADRVRELMKSRGVTKDPGFSWVQNRDGVHTFVAGEKVEDLDSVLQGEL